MTSLLKQRAFTLLWFILSLAFLLIWLLPTRISLMRPSSTVSMKVLNEAKAAIIGRATSRGISPLLLLPDMGFSKTGAGEGVSAGLFLSNTANMSLLGRLPWKSLGLPPLKDASGECLWYAVSASAKVSPTPLAFNWDTVGHFVMTKMDDADKENPHHRPLSLLFAPNIPLPGQNRTPSGSDQVIACGGTYQAAAYLDEENGVSNFFPSLSSFSEETPKVWLGSAKTRASNDLWLTITPQDLFAPLIKRQDFAHHVERLMSYFASCLNALSPEFFPEARGDKGIADAYTYCFITHPPAALALPDGFAQNWQDNLLYTGIGNFELNGTACRALLFFGGARTPEQRRATSADKKNPAMYLEGENATRFPNVGAYTARESFDPKKSSDDLAMCITGLVEGRVVAMNETDSDTWHPEGNGTSIQNSEIVITGSTKKMGGCLWLPQKFPMANKSLRAFYEYDFHHADTFALSGKGYDRGNGFALQIVRAGRLALPDYCGDALNMGVLDGQDEYGAFSWIIETDVRQNASGDPSGNHLAIMGNGELRHTLLGDLPEASCTGKKTACLLNPANTLEESPTPLAHRQRVEVETRCTSGCGTCDVMNGAGTYARIRLWFDCKDCQNLEAAYTQTPPKASRCVLFPEEMSSVYIGITGGFLTGVNTAQGVRITRLRVSTQ